MRDRWWNPRSKSRSIARHLQSGRPAWNLSGPSGACRTPTLGKQNLEGASANPSSRRARQVVERWGAVEWAAGRVCEVVLGVLGGEGQGRCQYGGRGGGQREGQGSHYSQGNGGRGMMAALASELEPSLIPSLPGGSNGSRTPTRTGKALRFLRYIHTLPFAVHPPRSTRPSQRHGASTPALSHFFHFFSSPPPPRALAQLFPPPNSHNFVHLLPHRHPPPLTTTTTAVPP
ncbi:hypothetical protein B0T13DRAFT_443979 [Neurospora crassa]|nr:hypothetical protein B0T13DRAFT_443979 [Neurospora crassa]